jgi:hypothetical protein
MIPHCLITSDAFRTMSPRALQVLMQLHFRHNGFNNGRIGLSQRVLAASLGCQNYHAYTRAIGELVSRGIIALARSYPKCQRLAREYRLTFIPTGETPATNDYLEWREGGAGSRKKRAAPFATETRAPGANIAAATEFSAGAFAASGLTDRGRRAECTEIPAAKGATHISNHPQPHGRGSPPRVSRPDGGRSPASVGSAAPDLEELRSGVLALLKDAVCGTQGRLAADAKIPASTFSNFIRRNGPLSEQSRIRLASALTRMGRGWRGRITSTDRERAGRGI